jgi:hypothetical protein
MMPKLIYFAERHPSLDPAAFRERWRAHGQLGMSLPRWRNVARYTQCDTIPDLSVAPRLVPCDGVATVVFTSEHARLSHVSDPDRQITRRDESETFARPVREFAVLTEESEFLAHNDDRIKLFAVITRPPSVLRSEFKDAWLRRWGLVLAAELSTVDPGAGYSQNHVRADSEKLGLEFQADSIDEITSSTPREATRLMNQMLTRPEFAELTSSVRLVVARENVLHGRRIQV